MNKAKEEKKAKERRPSAQKRALQSEKRRLANRSYRAKVLTAIRGFEQALEKKEEVAAVKSKLDLVFSLMDRGVKTGVYKLNKASRTKARLSARSA